MPASRYEYTSASQVEAFWRCERYWYNKSVLKNREVFSPAAAKGTRVHKAGEIYLSTGTPGEVSLDEQPILDALIAALPEPDPRFLVEHEFLLPTYEGGPGFKGFIDFMDPEIVDGCLTISDTKTRSDLRYAKKPSELAVDVQMVSYAQFAISNYDVETIKLQHLYVHTKPSGRAPNKKCKTLLVETIVTRNHVENEWAKIMLAVRQMQDWFEKRPDTAKPLSPRVTSCEMYGGCSYKALCGLVPKGMFAEPASPVVQINSKKEITTMGLAEKLAAKVAAKAAAGVTSPPVAPAAPTKPVPVKTAVSKTPPAKAPEAAVAPATGGLAAKLAAKKAAVNGTNGAAAPAAPKVALNPPDAPPDVKSTAADVQAPETAEDESDEEVKEEKPTKAKTTKTKKKAGPSSVLLEAAEEESEAPEVMADVGTPDSHAGTKPRGQVNGEDTDEAEGEVGPTVRPDNMPAPPGAVAAPPTEGFVIYVGSIPIKGESGYVLWEDWFRPLAEQLANNFGVADYRVVEFGKYKGPLANLIRMAVNEGAVPPVLVFSSSYAPGATEALDVLIPYARRVVMPLKG